MNLNFKKKLAIFLSMAGLFIPKEFKAKGISFSYDSKLADSGRFASFIIMKRVFILFLISVIFIFYNISCKKSSNKSVAQRIQGIWHVNNIIANVHSSGVDQKDTVVGIPSDVIDFRNDGKVYSFVQGTYDTSAYTIPTDTQIIINVDPFDIKTLTDNTLVLYAKATTGGSDYFEETENLKR